MCIIRTLSWNIRTFGAPLPTDVALRGLVEIMLASQADIICIQEIQCGNGASENIGAPVSGAIRTAVGQIHASLSQLDPGADWRWSLSGINNSGRAASMRDAYGFFWKTKPSGSAFRHADPLIAIAMLAEPEILRQQAGGDKFPGRRPGMMTFDLTTKASAKPTAVNIISWHAATPCNTIAKGGQVSSGRGIIELASLTEIGGVADRSYDGGRTMQLVVINPLPKIDTIVLGDFNYSLAESGAATAYKNLLTNYQPCVSKDGDIKITTYSADPTKPFAGTSSYDNIFVLRNHLSFNASVTYANNCRTIDFIAEKARELGNASGIQYFANEAAWYVIYLDNFKRQYGTVGLSDHLPVWADFNVTEGTTATDRVLATSGLDNNCLMHATFGSVVHDLYFDVDAANRRKTLANWIYDLNRITLAPVRQDLLSAMIVFFEDTPGVLNKLQYLLTNPWDDPFKYLEFVIAVELYVDSIRTGRMLYWHEAAILAHAAGISINLYRIVNGKYEAISLNGGQAQSVDIYHFGVHFFRYRAN